MTEPQELTLLSTAQTALSSASTIDEIRDLRNRAEALRAYARKARLGQHILVEASIVKVQAERQLGQMLRDAPLAKGALGNQYTGPREDASCENDSVRLQDIGVSKSDSSRAQRIAELSDEAFDAFLDDSRQTLSEATTAGLLRLAGRQGTDFCSTDSSFDSDQSAPTSPSGTPSGRGTVDNLSELIEQGLRFATIYAAPPWPYQNQATRGATDNHYATMSIDDICDEPVEQLAATNSHLHLWTTSTFLPVAFDVIEAWGFEYRFCFVWIKPQMGVGNYWRMSHELLLLGVRGNLAFQQKTHRSWLELPRNSTQPQA